MKTALFLILMPTLAVAQTNSYSVEGCATGFKSFRKNHSITFEGSHYPKAEAYPSRSSYHHMTSINLHAHEALRLKAGKETLLVRPVKEVSPKGMRNPKLWNYNENIWLWGSVKSKYTMISKTGDKVICPYQVGKPLVGKERWAIHDAQALHEKDASRIYYWADDPQHYESDMGWNGAHTMPVWASRFPSIIPARIECKLLSTITEGEGDACGMPSPLEMKNYHLGAVRKAWFTDLWKKNYPRHPFSSTWAWFLWIPASVKQNAKSETQDS